MSGNVKLIEIVPYLKFVVDIIGRRWVPRAWRTRQWVGPSRIENLVSKILKIL
jgi:hypothetical protein